MSIFSMLRRGRQAAREHSTTKQSQETNLEEPKPRYRHIPKHAAIDALSGGPPSYRESDRPKIQEHNRIRSSLTANGIGMTGTGSTGSLSPLHHTPRTGSSLSFVSYPSPAATPVVRDSSSSSASSSQDESSSSRAMSLRSAPRRKVARRASDASLGAGRTGSFRPTSFALSPPDPTMRNGAAHTTVPAHLSTRSDMAKGLSNTGSETEAAQRGSASSGYSGRSTPSLLPPQELEAEPVTVSAYRSGIKERRRRSTIISGLPMEFDGVSLLPPTQELVVPVEMVAGGMKRKGMWSMRGARRRVLEV